MKILIIILLSAFIAWLNEKRRSLDNTVLKEMPPKVDRYRLPIYSNPFLAPSIKPPTAC